MEEPQGTDTKVEGAEQAEKQVEPTQLKEEPTGKIYKTEEEYQRELQTAVSKGLESMQRQLDLRNAEFKKAESQLKSKETDLKALQEDLSEMEKLKFEDDETREAYTNRKAIRDARREVERAKAEVEDQRYEVEMERWRARMDAKAVELVKEIGIDINEFVGCQTEEEMEVKALRWERANRGSAKEEEEKPPKFAGAGSGGVGVDLNKMSPRELFIYGLEHQQKK